MLQPQREHEPVEFASGNRFAKRVLLIGWDGAEFSSLEPLLRSGRLPNLSSLLESGAGAKLIAPRPSLAPAAWTSLATGKRPHEHGILHASCPQTYSAVLRPVTRLDRRSVAIWNALNRAGLRTHIIGWPVSHPAEAVSGVCVSDRFAVPLVSVPRDRIVGSAVLPPEAESILRSRQVTLAQIEEMTVAQLLPQQAEYLPEYPRLAAICRAILAETATLFRVTRWCLGEQPWDFAACVFPGIRRCHELAIWLQNVSPAAEFREHLIAGCYEHHDLLLGQLLHQVGKDTHVIAISPTGNVAAIPRTQDDAAILPPAGSAIRSEGLAVVRGPGVRHSLTPPQRSVLDLAPTILAMFAVPYGKDMSGRPWLDLFEVDLKPKVIDTWETPAAEESVAPLHETEESVDEDSFRHEDENQAVKHLLELGYVDPREVAARQAVDQCSRSIELNRANSMMDAGELSQAVAVLERLKAEQPNWFNSRTLLAEAYYRDNQRESARAEIDWLMSQGVEKPQLSFILAAIEFSDRHFDLALDELRCAGRAGIKLQGSSALEGNIHLRRRDFAAAETAFRSSVNSEGPTHQSLDGLAAVHLHQERYEEAAVAALDALEQEMRFGRAHYHLAVALLHLDKPQEALRALESWAMVEPQSAAPFRWMAHISERNFGDAPRATAYRKQGREVVRRRRETLKSTRADDT